MHCFHAAFALRAQNLHKLLTWVGGGSVVNEEQSGHSGYGRRRPGLAVGHLGLHWSRGA